MPTVLQLRGFAVRIYLPPREHGPAHVHVHRNGGSVVIVLPTATRELSIRRVFEMRDATVIAACRVVEENADFLLHAWRRYHGDATDQ